MEGEGSVMLTKGGQWKRWYNERWYTESRLYDSDEITDDGDEGDNENDGTKCVD